uniref:Uncharacterized protein n=1 Tax=Arundo donax TaxID=35708 RepID=A0A0A8ZDD6_ARUDO
MKLLQWSYSNNKKLSCILPFCNQVKSLEN